MKNDDNLLSMYLKEINKIPLLTREEEVELAKKAKEGDRIARDKIVQANLRFVVNVAKKYQNRGLDLTDLISEGNIGLLTAIEKFDVNTGYHFISYAVWWIRQSILKAISEKSRAIRLPLNRVNEVVQIEKVRSEIGVGKSEQEEIEEIAKRLGMTKVHVQEMLSISKDTLSLDTEPCGESSSDIFLGDNIVDERYENPDDKVMADSMKQDIDKVLATLRPNEERVLRLRYGLDGEKSMSLKEVGDVCNLTKERIRQIEKHALARMKCPTRMRRLENYVA